MPQCVSKRQKKRNFQVNEKSNKAQKLELRFIEGEMSGNVHHKFRKLPFSARTPFKILLQSIGDFLQPKYPCNFRAGLSAEAAAQAGIELQNLSIQFIFEKPTACCRLKVFLSLNCLLASHEFFKIHDTKWNVFPNRNCHPGIMLSQSNLKVFTMSFIKKIIVKTPDNVSVKHLVVPTRIELASKV